MRLKSSIWVAAYLRRCQTEGIFGAVRKRGAEEAGAVFVKVALLDGNAMLYAPSGCSRRRRRSRCRSNRWKNALPRNSASIPTPGSSRPRTGQGGTFWIWRRPEQSVASRKRASNKNHKR